MPTERWPNIQYDNIHQLVAAYRSGERPRLGFTKHAAARIREMKLTDDEVFNVIAHPTHVGFSRQHRAMNLHGERFTLSIRLDGGGYPDILTVLWRNAEDWAAAAKNGTLGDGRIARADAFARKATA